MLTIKPTGAVLGATVRGLDLAQPLDESELGRILLALGRHGVLRFPDQHLDLASLQRFSELFGEIQGIPIRDADPASGRVWLWASASERIRLMEESLGAPLLERHRRGVRPTPRRQPSSITRNWSFSSWNGCVANCQSLPTA
jgi:alpha-ketoglutarate-dependent taurine dioxygenase